MPELPEAEAQRRLLDRCVVGQTIERVVTKEQGGGARDGEVDDKVLDGDVASLAGSRVVAANRKGKQLWLELDKGKTKHCLLIHLGMTGSCVIKGEAPPSYKAFSIDDAFPPKYTKLELVMDDGTRLAYCDPRRFGRIKLRGAEPAELAALAPDALEAPAVATMRSALSSKSAPIKAVLLDQSAVTPPAASLSLQSIAPYATESFDSLLLGEQMWSDLQSASPSVLLGNPPWEKLKLSRHEFLRERVFHLHRGRRQAEEARQGVCVDGRELRRGHP